ncbi:MAG TPA: hypothetical protein VMV59_07305 [Candidatus Dormibacteraeota bacterium]|nr:hypothetical protein [Candidatus Dormibacteraeota bacterium]
MTVFAIVNVGNPLAVEAALVANFPGDFLQLSPTEWLVAARGVTAKDVSDKLGISEGKSNGIVFTTAGYFGRAPNNVWEWIGVKIAQA